MDFKKVKANAYRSWLEQCEKEQQAEDDSPMQALKELIMTAFQLRQLPQESLPQLALQGQGVYFVRLDSGQEVLLQYRVMQEKQDCVVGMRVKINGQPSTMKEVVRLYSELRKGEC